MNQDTFFYQTEGKTVGPVSKTDVQGRIKDGKIRLFDLILKEGEASWRMALEHMDFKDDFKDKSKSALRDRPWVCLQRKSPDGFDFMTTGPFSFDEMREALMAGKVSYTDYVWRSGMSEWKRIGLLEDFNPRLRKVAEAVPVLPEDPAELVKNVVEMKRPRLPEPEMPPREAVTSDLTKKTKSKNKSAAKEDNIELPPALPELPPQVVEAYSEVAAEAETVIAPMPAPEVVSKVRKRRRKNVPWLDWGIVGILVVVLGTVALILSRNIKRSRTLEAPVSTVVETLPPQPSAPVDYEASEAELNAPEPEDDEPREEIEETAKPRVAKKDPLPSRAPTELVLVVQNRSQNQARVELRTNGSPDFPVYIQVIGVPGSVTSGPAFYKYLRLKPSGDPRQPLDLSKVKLPQGKLIFRASTGDLKKEAKLNVGTGDPQYKQAVNRVRKLHAYAIWSERLALLKWSRILETRVALAVSGQKFSAKGLETLNQVRLVNGYKYALFDDWFELKTAMDEARRQPSTATVVKVKRVHDKMLAYSIWK